MEGVIGLILVAIGLVLVYDVVSGKAVSIVDLFSGVTDALQPSTAKKGV